MIDYCYRCGEPIVEFDLYWLHFLKRYDENHRAFPQREESTETKEN